MVVMQQPTHPGWVTSFNTLGRMCRVAGASKAAAVATAPLLERASLLPGGDSLAVPLTWAPTLLGASTLL